MKKKLYIALMVVLALAFGLSAFYLGSYFLEGKKQADRYDELANIVTESQQQAASTTPSETQTTDPTETTANTDPTDPVILPGYLELHEQNPDLVGWIRIDGTKIDYPVMQTSTDNRNYYLYRNFDRENSDRGSIYAREECDIFAPSDTITLFGHNMKDGSMFAFLGEYEEKEAWEKNSLICFDTLYEYHVYKIFAVFKTSASIDEGFRYHQMENAASAQEFENFVKTCKSLAFYETGITPVYGDKLILLSTCEYTLDNGRLVVAAVQIS